MMAIRIGKTMDEARLNSLRRYRQCTRKLRHENYLSALQHAKSLAGSFPLMFLTIYPCEFCGGLHVSSGKRFHKPEKIAEEAQHLREVMNSVEFRNKAPREVQNSTARKLQALEKALAAASQKFDSRAGRLD